MSDLTATGYYVIDAVRFRTWRAKQKEEVPNIEIIPISTEAHSVPLAFRKSDLLKAHLIPTLRYTITSEPSQCHGNLNFYELFDKWLNGIRLCGVSFPMCLDFGGFHKDTRVCRMLIEA